MKESLRRCLRFLGKNWRKLGVAFVVLAVLALGLLVWPVPGLWGHLQEPGEAYYALRPSLVTAAAALFAAGFLFWRNITADKQLENAQLSLQEERYKKGVELLAHEVQVIRIGGLYVLHQLAEDSPKKWALPVMELMCLFVRMPPPGKDGAEGSGERQLRRDVEEAVQLLGIRNSARREEEKREHEKAKKEERGKSPRRGKSPGRGKLDFHGADLAWGSWEGVDLEGAYFRDATLTGARFSKSKLVGANFSRAKLKSARFDETKLTKANFYKAWLWMAHFERANITEAILKSANLSEVVLMAHRAFVEEDEDKTNRVMGLTRKQLEAGWIDPSRPPVKMIEDESEPGVMESWALTDADWQEELELDSPPRWKPGPPGWWDDFPSG